MQEAYEKSATEGEESETPLSSRSTKTPRDVPKKEPKSKKKTPRDDREQVEEEVVEKTDVSKVVESGAEPAPQIRPFTADTAASPRSEWSGI